MTLFTRRQLLMTAAFASPLSRLRAAEPVWQAKLESIRVKYELPALGAAIVTSAGLQSQAVCGLRKLGTEVAVTVDDLWHLGSNTKAFTATLAAMAVQAGKLRWESTLGEIFPDQDDLKKVPLAKATLTQLLSHWSGLPANPQWGMIMLSGQDLRAQREIALQMAARTADLPEPGTAHLYSNWGYVLAGHMLEQVWDAPWEELMKKQVFEPLGITHAGFGGTGSIGQIDQPWPHGKAGKPMPNNGPAVDNPAVLGPAGTLHMPLSDWAKFAADLLAGRAGKGKLLKSADAYLHLHTATDKSVPYAYGWSALERPWGGHVITHNGTNTMNYSVAWLAPEKDFGVIACTNSAAKNASKALDDVAGLLIQTY